jgi:predicted MFS family arabinose efflux permease
VSIANAARRKRGKSRSGSRDKQTRITTRMNHTNKVYPSLLIGAFTIFGTFIYGIGRYAYGLYIPNIEKEFHVSTLTLGMVASAGTLVFVLMTLLSAFILSQRFHIIWMLCAGGLVTSFGCFIVYFAHTPQLLLLGIVLSTACAGIAPPSQYRIFDQHLTSRWQSRAIACMNCAGTLGVLLVGVLSYSMQANWQKTWLVFSCCTLMATVIAVTASPAHKKRQSGLNCERSIKIRELYRPGVINLFILCLSYGTLLGCYYTYSAKLLSQYGGYTPKFQQWFWMLVGISGLTTVFSGDLISKRGIKFTLITAHVLNASSCVLIVFLINFEPAVNVAAITFGIGSMLPGSAILIWSMRLYRGRPTIAFGVMFALMSTGQALGSAISGVLGDTVNLNAAFLLSAAIVLASLLSIPRDTSECVSRTMQRGVKG